MKMESLLACILLFPLLGCNREPRLVQPAPVEAKTYSDGSNTWRLGAAIMNGTNVPLTNITIRVRANKAAMSQ